MHKGLKLVHQMLSSVKVRYLWFEVTDRCNSRCDERLCSIWKQQHFSKSQLLSISELKAIFSVPLFEHVEYVINSGGEPTLRKDLLDVLCVEHECFPNATLQLSSNALFPDAVIQAALYAKDIGVKRFDVGLSFDGIGKDHDDFRGVPGNFDKLDMLIDELNEVRLEYKGLHVTIGSTLTGLTAKRAEKLLGYAKKKMVPFMWHWFNQSSFYQNNPMPMDGCSKALSLVNNKSLYMEYWKHYASMGVLPKFDCYALRSFFVLRCNGDVVPCLSKWSEVVGNFREQCPVSVWQSSQAEKVRESIRNCKGCLNNWGCVWSLKSKGSPLIKHKLRQIVSRD